MNKTTAEHIHNVTELTKQEKAEEKAMKRRLDLFNKKFNTSLFIHGSEFSWYESAVLELFEIGVLDRDFNLNHDKLKDFILKIQYMKKIGLLWGESLACEHKNQITVYRQNKPIQMCSNCGKMIPNLSAILTIEFQKELTFVLNEFALYMNLTISDDRIGDLIQVQISKDMGTEQKYKWGKPLDTNSYQISAEIEAYLGLSLFKQEFVPQINGSLAFYYQSKYSICESESELQQLDTTLQKYLKNDQYLTCSREDLNKFIDFLMGWNLFWDRPLPDFDHPREYFTPKMKKILELAKQYSEFESTFELFEL
jgi:hypothetical protein